MMMWLTPIVLAIKDYEMEALLLGVVLILATIILVLIMLELYSIS